MYILYYRSSGFRTRNHHRVPRKQDQALYQVRWYCAERVQCTTSRGVFRNQVEGGVGSPWGR